ncbi:MAG: hypothetical protein GC181_04500 [Bacteroidetes bacterium]|nr:hypothetical protein [Bacteroidota bacterium]
MTIRKSQRILFLLLLTTLRLVVNAQDIPARFPGGGNAYDEFMQNNLKYPEKALITESDHTIKVLVKIDSVGNASVQNFIYERSGLGFEEEVESFISKMPRWIPALYNNVPSTSQIILTFHFNYVHEEAEPQGSYKLKYYDVSDIPPFYEFGYDSLMRYIGHIVHDSLQLSVKGGTCRIEFLVDTTGRLLNVSVLENKSDLSDNYWIYSFQSAGNWIPGLRKAKKVNVQKTLLLKI